MWTNRGIGSNLRFAKGTFSCVPSGKRSGLEECQSASREKQTSEDDGGKSGAREEKVEVTELLYVQAREFGVEVERSVLIDFEATFAPEADQISDVVVISIYAERPTVSAPPQKEHLFGP